MASQITTLLFLYLPLFYIRNIYLCFYDTFNKMLTTCNLYVFLQIPFSKPPETVSLK